MTRAILNDGSEVELAKDCGCVTHKGPHWLHYDHTWRTINRQIPRNDWLGAYAFCQEETRRLQVLGQEFSRHQIARLLPKQNIKIQRTPLARTGTENH